VYEYLTPAESFTTVFESIPWDRRVIEFEICALAARVQAIKAINRQNFFFIIMLSFR
jgi:hypothetical protein